MDAWLSFTSTLLWQLIVLVALLLFRSELKGLLQRLSRFKTGDTEVEFQQATTEALPPSFAASAESDGEDHKQSLFVSKALEIRDGEGFFTRHGVEALVQPFLQRGEKIQQATLVFSTPKQHTWLVTSNQFVYYILDDERTRASQKLVQNRLSIENALPVRTDARSANVGVFRLGDMSYWYYSFDMLGEPVEAKIRLENLITSSIEK